MNSGLLFDEVEHVYRFNGVRVPSVTQVLQPLANFEGIPPEVLERKRSLGQRVHAATQFFDEDDLDESSIEADVAPYLESYLQFMRHTGAKVVANEQRVFDPVLRYAGTLDRVMLINGEKVLFDLKTSFALPMSVGAQTAGYLRALRDPKVTRRAALRLRDDGTFRLDLLTDADDMSVFLACLALHNWKRKNNLERPAL